MSYSVYCENMKNYKEDNLIQFSIISDKIILKKSKNKRKQINYDNTSKFFGQTYMISKNIFCDKAFNFPEA